MPFKLINYLDSLDSSNNDQINIQPNNYNSKSNYEKVDQKRKYLKCKAFGIVNNV